ncbi:MAG: DUF2974 domain-containing protein [Clostridia bacterium]|nr:DUF2974 domain-containing protein [Clostridia bacterium]
MKKPEYSLTDYVKWTSGAGFDRLPFSERDALVLSDVIYFNIFREGSEGKTLRELIGSANVEDPSIVMRLGYGLPEHVPFIKAVAASRRFGGFTVAAREESFDTEKSVQFCAAALRLPGYVNFIAFRGTDDSIAGWKEDFMISFTKTEAQRMALDFAAANLSDTESNYISGHSKGGNLALYAAALLPPEKKAKVKRTFVLDGPGFCSDVLDLSLIEKAAPGITRIIPEYSIIGKLFEPNIPDTRIVASSETGLMQHELLSWGVTPEGLDEVRANDPGSADVSGVIKSWIEDVPTADRKKFIEEFFGALESGGSKTMSEVSARGIDGFDEILFKMIGSSEEAKKTAAGLPGKLLFGDLFKMIREKGILTALRENELLISLLLIAGGILTACISRIILEALAVALFAGFSALQIFLTLKRLRACGWKFDQVRDRIYINIIMLVIVVCLIFKEGALFLTGSGIFSALALVLGFQSLMKVSDKEKPLSHRILSGFETAAAAIYGIAFLVIPQNTVFAFALSAGILLAVDGIVRLITVLVSGRKR